MTGLQVCAQLELLKIANATIPAIPIMRSFRSCKRDLFCRIDHRIHRLGIGIIEALFDKCIGLL
jgi:hypothetical protein